MGDSGTWHLYAEQFARHADSIVVAECVPAMKKWHGRRYTALRWQLAGDPLKVDAFRALAGQAAMRLGCARADAWMQWLDRLYAAGSMAEREEELRAAPPIRPGAARAVSAQVQAVYASHGMDPTKSGIRTTAPTKRLTHVFEASTQYCVALADRIPTVEVPTATRQRFQARATWLKDVLGHLDLTAYALQTRHDGPDAETTKKILKGDAVSENTLRRLARALTEAGRNTHPDDIPAS